MAELVSINGHSKIEVLRKDLLSADRRERRATLALMASIASQVSTFREHRSLTQSELAKLAGTTQSKISKIEKADAESNWEVDTLLRVSRALDVRLKVSFETFGSLLTEMDEPSVPLSATIENLAIANPDPRKERLLENLRDKEYREEYATTLLFTDLSAQVKALRRQRGYSQEDLANRIGTQQPKLSSIENPFTGVDPPNLELSTLQRVGYALGVRLKISFEPYATLVTEMDSVTSDSLRRVPPEADPALHLELERPSVDVNATERVRMMQELVIPWLCDEAHLGISKLLGWLKGMGLPGGYDEDAYQWILSGIPSTASRQTRQFLERRLAERLALVLGEQPDETHIVAEQDNEFLANLYWTCAGLNCPGFLAEQLWEAYKRLKETKLSGPVRDALQAAIVQNQFGDKPLKEIWEPMIEKGRHPWLRGSELVGFEGLRIRSKPASKQDLDKLVWALDVIARKWQGTQEDALTFGRMISKDVVLHAQFSQASATAELPEWARKLFPRFTRTANGFEVECGDEIHFGKLKGKTATVGRRIAADVQYSEVFKIGPGEKKLKLLNAMRELTRKELIWQVLSSQVQTCRTLR